MCLNAIKECSCIKKNCALFCTFVPFFLQIYFGVRLYIFCGTILVNSFLFIFCTFVPYYIPLYHGVLFDATFGILVLFKLFRFYINYFNCGFHILDKVVMWYIIFYKLVFTSWLTLWFNLNLLVIYIKYFNCRFLQNWTMWSCDIIYLYLFMLLFTSWSLT